MSRVFFDTMMFVYLLEDNAEFAPAVRTTLERCYLRNDTLLTSCLAVGEVMAGWKGGTKIPGEARATIKEMGFNLVPFGEDCMDCFARLRADERVKAPDAMHLASAAAARTDMFLTNDGQLLRRRLLVPGIQFIGDFTTPVL